MSRREHVVLFDTPACQSGEGPAWRVSLHAWVHEPRDSRVRLAALARLLRTKYGLRASPTEKAILKARANPFLVSNTRGRRLEVELCGRTTRMPATRGNGHARCAVELAVDGHVSETVARACDGNVSARVHLIPRHGVSVISDIDDTIKVSHVGDRQRLLEQSFLREMEPVAGMSDLYRAWHDRGARFHFVSSSPWQLHEALREFTTTHSFPPATFHLKHVRLKDRSILDLFKAPQKTKPRQLEPLLDAYPERRFVLVGDSGEQDPEVYASLMRERPRQIRRIYIRNVTNERRTDSRFRDCFVRLPAERWELFDDPSTLELPPPA